MFGGLWRAARFPADCKGGHFPWDLFCDWVRLCAVVVRLPILDELFDRLSLRKFFIEHFARECGQFGIASESQRDQLPGREFTNSWLQIRGQQPRATQPLFQPNDAILHFHREGARADKPDHQRGGKQHGFESIPRKPARPPSVDLPAEIDGDHG